MPYVCTIAAMLDIHSGRWSLGTLIGLPVIVAVLAVLVLALVLLRRWYDVEREKEYGDTFLPLFLGVVTALGAITLFAASAFGYYPYDPSFHQWYTVRGTVQESNKRLISDGDNGMSERYVIRFRESSTLYGCDDTRCSLATPGKTITLKCKREYQFQSTSGWACNYDQED